uniref:Uncharacterized protein n=1 Tax=Prolemur simus TaxID=1328070 RepID=A0A8C9AUF4_PROSS
MEGGKWRQNQRRVSMSWNGFYACPGFRTGEMRCTCGGIESFYCAAWRCVTTNDGEWRWKVQPLFIKMSYVRPCSRTRYASDCNLICVRFTDEGKKDRRWVSGLSWGVYLYQHPYFGTVIQLKLRVSPISGAVGPNPVLGGKQDSPRPTVAPLSLSRTPVAEAGTQVTPRADESGDPLWKTLTAAYEALNRSNPNATEACWLCYDIRPPFYEAVGVHCTWDCTCPLLHVGLQRPRADTSGSHRNGTCVGKVAPSHAQICAKVHPSVNPTGGTKWLVPALNGWWVCSKTGLTPMPQPVFNESEEFCIMVLVFPKVIYHQENIMYDAWTKGTEGAGLARERREPFFNKNLSHPFRPGCNRSRDRYLILSGAAQGA